MLPSVRVAVVPRSGPFSELEDIACCIERKEMWDKGVGGVRGGKRVVGRGGGVRRGRRVVGGVGGVGGVRGVRGIGGGRRE